MVNERTKYFDEKDTQAVEELFDRLNKGNMGFAVAGALIAHLKREHRTLQQNFFRAIGEVIEWYAEEAQTDLRNQASKEWCIAVNKAALDRPFLFV